MLRSQAVRGFALGVKAAGDVQGHRIGVVWNGVDVGGAGDQVLGHPALPAVAGLPEGVVELVATSTES